ncbi:DUF4265 domain-containing protein [Corynebacterium pacaense]|uniref:DUF4265 domain-containing protein n=1 Tax=Corynebacterium pacaense TaxID=1816684 RepID=UPI0015C489B1|nr:DUF4265 domain-containing protein [Corynebacterium pacaense]
MATRMMMRVPLDVSAAESEHVLVEDLGGGLFIIVSVPAVSTQCALGDVVRGEWVEGMCEFRGVEIRGGNTTLRMLVDASLIDTLLAHLEALGCRHIQPLPGMVSVNIPVDAPAHGLSVLIGDYVEQGLITVAEGDLDSMG